MANKLKTSYNFEMEHFIGYIRIFKRRLTKLFIIKTSENFWGFLNDKEYFFVVDNVRIGKLRKEKFFKLFSDDYFTDSYEHDNTFFVLDTETLKDTLEKLGNQENVFLLKDWKEVLKTITADLI